MYYDALKSEEQISYLIKPILEVLQAAGANVDLATLDVAKVRNKASAYWEEHAARNKAKNQQDTAPGGEAEEEESSEEEPLDDFKVKLMEMISLGWLSSMNCLLRQLLRMYWMNFMGKNKIPES